MSLSTPFYVQILLRPVVVQIVEIEARSQENEFDACELQIARYLGLKSRGAPITAIPSFPHRRFNHSCVMVRLDSDIARPEDLRGRRVGIHAHFNPIALKKPMLFVDQSAMRLLEIDE